MERYRSVRMSFVRRIKVPKSSRVRPTASEPKYPTTHLSSNKYPCATSTNSFGYRTLLSKTPLDRIDTNQYNQSSSPILAFSSDDERSSNKKLKDFKATSPFKKVRSSKRSAIDRRVIIALCVFILLLALIAMIFSIIAFDRSKTTPVMSTTTTTTTVLLRWMTLGITVAGIGNVSGTAVNQLNGPVDIVLDSSNSLYIADYFNNRVQVWQNGSSSGTTIAGQSSGIAGTTATDLKNPTGILLDSIGNLYVTDSLNSRVQLWNNSASSGTTIAGVTSSAGPTNNQLSFPYFLARDSNTNTLYIADLFNDRVVSYSSGASNGTVVAGGNGQGSSNIQLFNPVGIYLDTSSNSLLISNFGAHTVVRWVLDASNWTLIAGIAGMVGSSSTQLNSPAGVTVDYMGNIYVADTKNHRIQLFLVGQTTGRTIAGSTNLPGPTAGLLCRPYSVKLDSSLNLYVADTFNHRVQLFLRF